METYTNSLKKKYNGHAYCYISFLNWNFIEVPKLILTYPSKTNYNFFSDMYKPRFVQSSPLCVVHTIELYHVCISAKMWISCNLEHRTLW